MKKTFFIAMPRSGTFALSKMLTTETSLAHHETDLEGVVMGQAWDDTNAGRTMAQAEREGKNYICLNQSFGLQLLDMYLLKQHKAVFEEYPNLEEASDEETARMHDKYFGDLNVVYLYVNPGYSIDSLYKLSGETLSQAQRQAIAGQLFQFSGAIVKMKHILCELFIPQIFINKQDEGIRVKDRLFFNPAQLTEMCGFTGATTENVEGMQFLPLSLTWQQLRKSGERLRKALDDKGGKIIHSMFDLLLEADKIAKGKEAN